MKTKPKKVTQKVATTFPASVFIFISFFDFGFKPRENYV